MKNFTIFLVAAIIIFAPSLLSAQKRVAVLPFQNMDGKIELNVWCFNLQDTLYKALLAEDPQSQSYSLVPAEEVEAALANLNVDPTNPQYATDMWKAVSELKVETVVMGNFNIQAKRFLINCYIYDVKTKLPDPAHQARDIFKKQEKIYESIPIILDVVLPALKK